MIELDRDKCMVCGGCGAVCPESAIEVLDTYVEIDQSKCISCAACVKMCPVGALVLK